MFANPYMLIGLSLAVLPIVVHLLSRARYRSVDWGAMMFLEGADAAQSHSRRFNELLLLLIRSAIIALLAVALARPEVRGAFSSAGTARRGMAVILLDCSASMSFDDNGNTRIDLAREASKQLLSLHRGDRVSLVLMGQPQAPADRIPTADLWDVGRRIEAAQTGHARADVAQALDEALAAVEPAPDAVDRGERQFVTFYVVTDRQATNWQQVLDDADGEWADGWKQRLARAGVVGRLVCIPVGAMESENVVLRSIELLNGPAVAGQPVELEVKVQNYGPVQWASMPLQVTADRRTVFDQKVNLQPDSVASFRVAIPNGFADAGTHVISAEIDRQPRDPAAAATGTRPGGLTGDDRMELVVEVKEPIRVLVIGGDDSFDWMGDEDPRFATPTAADYLSAALAPFKAAKKKTPVDPCTVEQVPADRWNGLTVQQETGKKGELREVRLSQYQVVVLAGPEHLGEAQATALEQFLYDGGGVLIAPGNLTRAEDLNLALFRDGAGILPAALAEPTGADWADQTTLLGFDAAHPVLRFLGGRPDAFLPITVGRYFPVEQLASQGRVLMRYATGDPFLIESVAGSQRRGRLLLMTTPLGADWSTLPLSNFYLPFLQSTARYLGEGQPRRLNLAPGEPIEIPLDDSSDGRVVRIKPPDLPEERPAELARVGSQLVARFLDTETPGLYLARIIDPGRRNAIVHFTVAPQRDESDLTSLTPADWQKLERRADVRKLDPSVTPITSATALPAPLELWPWALGAVFVLGVLEMKLSRMWSRTSDEPE